MRPVFTKCANYSANGPSCMHKTQVYFGLNGTFFISLTLYLQYLNTEKRDQQMIKIDSFCYAQKFKNIML